MIHQSIIINKTNIIANNNIQKNTIILISKNNYIAKNYHTPALDIIYQMINDNEKQLFPRDDDKYNLDKDYIKILEYELKNCSSKYKFFFNKISYEIIKQYYAKYIFNAFTGSIINILGARFNHNCNHNIKYISKNNEMIFITNRDIKKGEELFNNYLLNKKIDSKHNYIKKHYDFICKC